MAEQTAAVRGMLRSADFFFSVCREEIPGQGESSFVYALNEGGALLGVFDGRSRPGAAPYEKLQNKSEGYLAARAVSAAYLDWFEQLTPGTDPSARELKPRIRRFLSLCERWNPSEAKANEARLAGTAAVALARPARGRIDLHLHWAGDSRVCLLDAEGLARLTEDDAPGNLLCLGREFKLHSARLSMARPCLLFAANAAFFRSRETEMELEYLFLRTLQSADSAKAWEEALAGEAKGESCVSGIALGFGSFDQLKRQLAGRTGLLYRNYIRGLEACSEEERELLRQQYRTGLDRLLCRR